MLVLIQNILTEIISFFQNQTQTEKKKIVFKTTVENKCSGHLNKPYIFQ